MSEELQRQIDALRTEVAELRAQLWSGGPRLGPRQDTPEEIAERTTKLTDAIVDAVRKDESPALCTTNGRPVAEVRANQTNETGQHEGYVVLCPDERAKGFVRPYRDAYEHVGRLEEMRIGLLAGKWRVGGCGTVTTMGRALSETYARDPHFYGATFCCGCNRHLPVAEFVWTADGQPVGS
jgi:hypothetical protein